MSLTCEPASEPLHISLPLPSHVLDAHLHLDRVVDLGRWLLGGLVFKAHRRVYHSTLSLSVIKRRRLNVKAGLDAHLHLDRVVDLGRWLRTRRDWYFIA